MSESYILAVFLTLSGGFQDAYTYFCRGGVFANAQTGNVVLLSKYFFSHDFVHALPYIISLLSFNAGVFCAEMTHHHFGNTQRIHWRNIILVLEILVLFVSGLISERHAVVTNLLISFVCALQVQSFRTLNGTVYSSTMCIGNMRTATEALCNYINTKNTVTLKVFFNYAGILLMFAIGAGIGSILTLLVGERAIWFSCILLTGALFIHCKQ